MTGLEVGFISVIVGLGSVIVTSKVNGRNKLTKTDHETLCSARLNPLHDDVAIIKADVKKLLSR